MRAVYGEEVVEQVTKFLMYYKEVVKQKVKEGDIRYIETMDINFDKYYTITKAVTRSMLGMSLVGYDLVDASIVKELSLKMEHYMTSETFEKIKEDMLVREAFLGYAMYILNLYRESGLPLEIAVQ